MVELMVHLTGYWKVKHTMGGPQGGLAENRSQSLSTGALKTVVSIQEPASMKTITQKINVNRQIGILTPVLAMIFTLLCATLGGLQAKSQAVYGSIFGMVTDKSGAALANVTIIVTDVSKGTAVTVKTNEIGLYRVQHLIPDTYTVQAEGAGFNKTEVNSVVVYADTSPEVDMQMSVGSVTNTVVVTDETPLLETDRAEVSTILDSRAVSDLPNMNRNFTEFELLTPGTSYIGWSVGEGSGNPQRSGQIEVDGQLPFATGYELDGTDNQEPLNGVEVINPNLDSVSEMKVTAQNYDAEFGKAVAGLVTAQTKSGSNAFHGTAFEYRRSDAQQARDPFANAPPNNVLPPTLHNQFGGSVGGPIKRDKLFFFTDYQGLREKTGTSVLTTVPTTTAVSTCTGNNASGYCDLSDYLALDAQAYQPISLTDTSASGRTPFPDNHIPNSELSPAAVAFFQLFTAYPPNAGAAGALVDNYSARGSAPFNTNQPDVRIDYTPRENLHIFGRYTFFGGNLIGAPYFGEAGSYGFGAGSFAGTDDFHYSSIASGFDYVVSPKWLTDFRFGYYRIYNNSQGPDVNTALGNQLGIPNANLNPLSEYGGMPEMEVSAPQGNGVNEGATTFYGTTASTTLQETAQYQFVNNWTHVIGKHNYKMGIDFRYGKNSTLTSGSGYFNFNGEFAFANSRTAGVSASGVTSPGLGFATFLLGDATEYNRSVTSTTGAQETTQKRLFAYAQDQWRMTPKLAVNYGLRWELYTPEAVTQAGEGGLLNLDTGNVDIAGYGGFNNELGVRINRTEYAPRLGVTFQPVAKTVIRAGYGIVYGQGWSGNTFGDVLTSSYPVEAEQSLASVSPYAAVFNLSSTESGVAPGPPVYAFAAIPSTGEYPLPNGISQPTRPSPMRLPTVQGWNLTVEREISPTLAIQVGYVGSEAYHNMFDSSNQFNPNEATVEGFDQINPATGVDYTLCEREPYCGDAGGNAQELFNLPGHPFGWTQSLRDNYNEATEHYNALQVVMTKRVSGGLSFLSHYTWSHAINHESYQFLIDPLISKGNSYYNRRQQFIFAGDYDLPFGRNKLFASSAPGWVNEIIGGFQLNGTLTWDTGLPFSPCYNEVAAVNDVAAADGCGPSWPNKVPGQSANIHKGSFNAQSLTVPYLPTCPQPLALYGQPGDTCLAYATPMTGTWGNWGRNSLWGPGIVDVDSSLSKSFALRENVNLHMIVQAYNLFNHVNYGNPSSCIDCLGISGDITSTLSEQDQTSLRFLQFAARVSF
jgi:hypothetical protein